MTNGSNSWNVSFSYISWLDRLLKNHDNVTNVERHDDIIFEIDRKGQKDHLKVLCCNEYAMGLTLVQRGLSEFGNVNIFILAADGTDTPALLRNFVWRRRLESLYLMK